MNKKHDIEVGKIYDTNTSGPIKVLADLGYEDFDDKHHRYFIKFLNSNRRKIVRGDHIISGSTKDPYPLIDFNEIRESYKCGKFKIIEYVGVRNEHTYVKIVFLDSLAESIVPLYVAESGKVHDPMFGFNPNKVFQSNVSGPFIMLDYIGKIKGHAFVTVKFLNTGFIRDVQMYNALDGKISDPSLKGKISTDFDQSRFDDYEAYINKKLKNVYRNMIDRCTNPNSQEYQYYGAMGISVCDRWLESFDNFIDDAKLLQNYDKYYQKPYMYELDKDYLQITVPKHKRVYSPETCIFLLKQDNINLKAIEYKNEYNSNAYFGVQANSAGNYNVGIWVNGEHKYIGTFSNIKAAANAFNYAFELYHEYELVPLFNEVEFMTLEETNSYKL